MLREIEKSGVRKWGYDSVREARHKVETTVATLYRAMINERFRIGQTQPPKAKESASMTLDKVISEIKSITFASEEKEVQAAIRNYIKLVDEEDARIQPLIRSAWSKVDRS